MQAIIAFILVFSIIVIFHEFGHYYFAKRAGILVREFSIGMGPKIYHYEGDETTYTLRLLPIGGYVRMAGMEEEMSDSLHPGMQITILTDADDHVHTLSLEEEEQNFEGLPFEVTAADLEVGMYIEGVPFGANESRRYLVNKDAKIIEPDGTQVKVAPIERQFQSASIFNRILTNFAGPLNNFILAIVAFILLGFLQGGVGTNDTVIGEVIADSPAAQSGLQAGDKVISVDGTTIDTFEEMGAILTTHPDESVEMTIERDSQEQTLEVTPKGVEQTDGSKIGQIGVMDTKTKNPLKIIAYGFSRTWDMIAMIFSVLISMFKNGFNIDNFGGPVYMYQATSEVVRFGLTGIISWIGALSINLGIVNLLPIPALDGGKLLLNIVELVRGKPLSSKVEGYINLVGVALVLLLMIAVTWNDIMRFFG